MTLDTTQSCDGHEGVPAGNAGTEQLDAQESSHLHVTDPDPASDDDTSRPVRERLKKASIASMPKNDTATKSSSAADDQRLDTNPEESQKRDSPNGQTPSPTAEPRGRLSRKRSYDDTIAADRGASATTTQVHHEEDVSHARKRSRDVRAIQIPSMEAPAITTVQSPLEEGINDEETLDQEIEDSVQSPRKKRSRDEFDVDAHREQKIPATDEAKAYRRSEDSERGQVLQQDDTGATSIDSTTQEKQDTNKGNETLLQQTAPPERAMNPSQSTAQASFPEIASTAVEANPKSSQKPPGGFAASGFAAMSGSSKSPFGTLGTSTPSVFGTKTTTTPSATGTMSTEPHKPQPSTSTFSSSASPFVTSTPGSSGQSGFGFGANGAATKPNSFGGSVFGSAFVNSAAAAPKLTSFAAPTGDLAPSKPAESTKGFGVQTDDSGDEDGGSEVDANPEEVGAGDTEVDGRFQQQEGEGICLLLI